MSTVSKYWDKYRERHRSESVEKPDMNKLMTDKQAYISFLEVQLERVTQSVLTTQGFSDRIESLQSQVNSSDEKIINLTRLIKLQQTYAESQEDEISNLKKILEGGERPHGGQGLEKKIRQLEDRVDSARNRDEGSRYEEFIKEVESALRLTESKITGLLNKVSEELEAKQKKHQKNIEFSLEQCTNEFNDNYKELSKKIAKIREDSEIDGKMKRLSSKMGELEGKSFEGDFTMSDRMEHCEKSLKDLEQFLVAIAEEVKKVEEKYLDTSAIEYRISEKLNSKVERLSELVRKSLQSKEKVTVKASFTPEKKDQSIFPKESPKFPNAFSSQPKPFQEDLKPRSKSKDSDNSHERTSKSPKSVTSRSKKSNSSSKTPKSNSSSRTPKSKKSVSPKATPPRRKGDISPGGTPKATTKSKAMEVSIKQKIKEMKIKDNEEKKIQLKKDEKKKTTKKKNEKRSKLDKLYQELSGKS